MHLGNNSPDGWAYDGVFVPAYNDANSTLTSHCTSAACQPFGQWSVKDFWTRQTWYEWGRWLGLRLGIRRDMGGAILNLNENGQKISEVVGNLGFAWNQPREQTWSFFGYPGDPSPPFSPYASKAFICYGDYGYSVAIGLPSLGPEMSAMGCNMGHGSSGGPWIKDFGSGDYLGGQMSFLRPTSEALSPYFDDEANSLRICLVDGNC